MQTISRESARTPRPADRGPRRDSGREVIVQKLDAALEQMQVAINREFESTLGVGLLEKDGSVSMRAFMTKNGGPYRKTTPPESSGEKSEGSVGDDEAYVLEKEDIFASEWASEQGMRPQDHDPAELRRLYDEAKEKRNGTVLEKALAVMLHKIIGDKFLVVRASKFDDIGAGVDLLIVDKETGQVVCSADDVNDEPTGARAQVKIKKMLEKAKSGGTEVKYGVTFDTTKGPPPPVTRQKLSGVPSFYLPVSEADLHDLVTSMGEGISTSPSTAEIRIFDLLMATLEDQKQMLAKEPRVRGEVRARLEAFTESLSAMKKLRQRYKGPTDRAAA